jgi:hypothetical protein
MLYVREFNRGIGSSTRIEEAMRRGVGRCVEDELEDKRVHSHLLILTRSDRVGQATVTV